MEKLKAILAELGLRFRFEVATVDKFEEQDKRLYALEENRKLKDAHIQGLQKHVGELRLSIASLQNQLRGKD